MPPSALELPAFPADILSQLNVASFKICLMATYSYPHGYPATWELRILGDK